MSTASMIATIALALIFLSASSLKLFKVKQSLEIRDHLGRTPRQWTAIGLVELAGVAGLLVGFAYQPLATLAAIGLGLMGIGALASHVQAKDGPAESVAAVLAVALAVLALVFYATT
ncbi:MAG: DoxX family protein [Aeromicrobium sp.]